MLQSIVSRLWFGTWLLTCIALSPAAEAQTRSSSGRPPRVLTMEECKGLKEKAAGMMRGTAVDLEAAHGQSRFWGPNPAPVYGSYSPPEAPGGGAIVTRSSPGSRAADPREENRTVREKYQRHIELLNWAEEIWTVPCSGVQSWLVARGWNLDTIEGLLPQDQYTEEYERLKGQGKSHQQAIQSMRAETDQKIAYIGTLITEAETAKKKQRSEVLINQRRAQLADALKDARDKFAKIDPAISTVYEQKLRDLPANWKYSAQYEMPAAGGSRFDSLVGPGNGTKEGKPRKDSPASSSRSGMDDAKKGIETASAAVDLLAKVLKQMDGGSGQESSQKPEKTPEPVTQETKDFRNLREPTPKPVLTGEPRSEQPPINSVLTIYSGISEIVISSDRSKMLVTAQKVSTQDGSQWQLKSSLFTIGLPDAGRKEVSDRDFANSEVTRLRLSLLEPGGLPETLLVKNDSVEALRKFLAGRSPTPSTLVSQADTETWRNPKTGTKEAFPERLAKLGLVPAVSGIKSASAAQVYVGDNLISPSPFTLDIQKIVAEVKNQLAK